MARERVDRSGEATIPPVRTSLTVAEIRQLISLMNASDIEEITIEHESDGLKLVLRKPSPVAHPAGSPVFDLDGLDGAEMTASEDIIREKEVEVTASLVGVFRTNMRLDTKALVTVGDIVREGQVVAAIEALNVLNEVEVSTPGRVKEILVSDGQKVEYGQPLMIIDPQPA